MPARPVVVRAAPTLPRVSTVRLPSAQLPQVVLNIDPEHLLEMTASDDQQPVQALGTYGPDSAFRMGVRVGA